MGKPFATSAHLRSDKSFWLSYYRFKEANPNTGALRRTTKSLFGQVYFDDGASRMYGGLTWRWHREKSQGVDDLTEQENFLQGAPYTPLEPGERIFDFTTTDPQSSDGRVAVVIVLYDGEILTASFRLIIQQGRQMLVDLTPPIETLQFIAKDNRAEGLFGGTFQGTLNVAGEPVPRRFSGAVVNQHNGLWNDGYGFVEGPPSQPWKTGRITMTPAPIQ